MPGNAASLYEWLFYALGMISENVLEKEHMGVDQNNKKRVLHRAVRRGDGCTNLKIKTLVPTTAI